MEFNHNDAAVCTDSINARAVTTSAGEIDLYDELIAFAELSPEEQLRLVGRPEKASAEIETPSAEEAEEHTSPEPVLTHAPIEPVEAETAAAEIETSSAEEAEEHTSPEPVLTHAPIEAVEAETAAAETETPSAEEAEEHTSPEPILTHPPIEPVESDTTVPAAESACDSEVSKAYVEPTEVRLPLVGGPSPSGPLSGLNLTSDFVFTGALSRGVCVACGGESGADDLFCITCGVFIDPIASTLPFNPTCGECKQGIAADEIFCPWCGSVLPAA